MRRHQQPVDLLVRIVGEREHDPVRAGAGLAGLDGDAAHDAVAPRRGEDADLVAVRAVALDHRGEVDGAQLRVHAHGLDRPSVRRPRHESQGRDKEGYGERNDPQRWCLSSGRHRPASRTGRQA
jgi:hypothetical protein